MLRAPFDRPEVLAKLRPSYEARRALVLPGACDPSLGPRPAFRPFFLAHRGRYGLAEIAEEPGLRMLAEAVTGLALRHAWTRVFRFRRGGYSLYADDAATRIHPGVEVVCDLSAGAAGPPCFYGDLTVPQLPGLLAVVERDGAVFRRDRYLTQDAATVVRLRAAFGI